MGINQEFASMNPRQGNNRKQKPMWTGTHYDPVIGCNCLSVKFFLRWEKRNARTKGVPSPPLSYETPTLYPPCDIKKIIGLHVLWGTPYMTPPHT